MENNQNIQLKTIRKNKEILDILKTSKKTKSNAFDVWKKQIKSENVIYFALLANKSTFKTAVERNKIKRQLRMMLIQSGIQKPIQILIKPNLKFLNNTYQQNEKELIKLIEN